MSQSPSQFDVSSLNGAQQCDCWRHHSSSLVCVRSVACLGFCRFPQCKKPGSRSILSAGVMPSTYHQLTWYNSLWLWRWLPHRLSKRQSLSATTVLFRTTFTRTIKLSLLLKWLLGSNLSQYTFSRIFNQHCLLREKSNDTWIYEDHKKKQRTSKIA